MAKRTDEVKVGLLVVVAVVILVLTVFLVGKAQVFGPKSGTYQAKLKFAGGVEQGTVVRFAGIKAGTVSSVQIDPQDSSQVLLSLEIKPGTPVRTDSVVSLQTLGLLGDFYVEVTPGSKQSALLPAGGTLQSKEAVLMSQLFDQINDLSKDSKTLIANLNEKLDLLSDQTGSVLTNVNSVFNESNKQELAAILRNGNILVAHGTNLIDKEGPKIDATLTEIQKASEKITPLLENVKASLDRLDGLVKNVDSTVTDLRPDLKEGLAELKKVELQTQALLAQAQEMLRHNRSDIDEIITNLAASSRNVEDLTNTLKQKPYAAIGIRTAKDRKVSGGKK